MVVAPALFALSDVYPLLSFQIALHAEKVDLFANGVDLAVRIGALPDLSGLSARRLGTQRIVACASSRYLDAHGVPEVYDDLARHALIATSRNGREIPWVIPGADGGETYWPLRAISSSISGGREPIRNLSRLFNEHVGMSVVDYVNRIRLTLARELVIGSQIDMDSVAERSGFASTRQFRRAWGRVHPVTPARLRALSSS